jgi:hypothetical protein
LRDSFSAKITLERATLAGAPAALKNSRATAGS